MIDNTTRVSPTDLLKDHVEYDEYTPAHGIYFYLMHSRPIFTYRSIIEISTDPRVQFGLGLIKGPLQTHCDWDISASSPEVEKFVRDQLEWFWLVSANTALTSLEWGFSGSEAIYREEDGKIQFKDLRYLTPLDLRAVLHKNKLAGMYLQRHTNPGTTGRYQYIGGPKKFWTVHDREHNPYYGRSRLFAVHPAWWEKWYEGGYRDIRRLWFHKNAFDSGTLYYPEGSSKLPTGETMPNVEIARKIAEYQRTGGARAMPSKTDANNKRQWEYEGPASNTTPPGLLEYGKDIDKEILEALGVPPEVVESQSSEGFGSSSGREIPVVAFFSSLQQIFNRLTFDFVEQVLDYLVLFNFQGARYKVIPKKLIEVYMKQMNPELEQQAQAPPAQTSA